MGCDDYPHLPDPDPLVVALTACLEAMSAARPWVCLPAFKARLDAAAELAERALKEDARS